jgi:hypothetical protein
VWLATPLGARGFFVFGRFCGRLATERWSCVAVEGLSLDGRLVTKTSPLGGGGNKATNIDFIAEFVS